MRRMLPTSCIWTSNPSSMFGYRPGLLLQDFQINTTQYTFGFTQVPVIGWNPDRFALIIWAAPGLQHMVGSDPRFVTGAFGMFQIANTGAIVTFKDYGPLVPGSWYAQSMGPAGNGTVTEVLYKPQGGDLSAAKISRLDSTQFPPSVIQLLTQPSPKLLGRHPNGHFLP